MVSPAELHDHSPRRQTLEELIALLQPGQRLACLAELREYPSEGSDRAGKHEQGIAGPEHSKRLLNLRARSHPVALEQVEPGHGLVSETDRKRELHRLGELEHLGSALGRLSKSAELGETR